MPCPAISANASHGDAPEEVKQRILTEAGLFVLPTRGVPIMEALGAWCVTWRTGS